MPQNEWKSPPLGWNVANQDANLAFTLVAVNERARQMWADPHNMSRYIPASFTRNQLGDGFFKAEGSAIHASEQLRKKEDTEPALQFLFNNWPKDFAKGYVLGSYEKSCDALLGDPGDGIPKEMLAFTFNKQHQLTMNVLSDHQTLVTFNQQKQGNRERFTWIFPHGKHEIRVKMANGIEFDVVLPEYRRNRIDFHDHCERFLRSAVGDDLLGNSLGIETRAVTEEKTETSKRPKWFYLRGEKLGGGSYGSVFKALQMPSGKVFAAKRFDSNRYLKKEVTMLRKVCENTKHENIVQFVGEWYEDYKPVLIMEYVVGGDLRKQMEDEMGYGQIANLAKQTLSALAFVHERNIMHRDLKPENILCAGPNLYKLGDFGLSREVSTSASRQGTCFYMAPEVDGSAFYDFNADVWSAGVILAECVNGLPEGGPDPAQVRRWCRKILREFHEYYVHCDRLPQMGSSGFFCLLYLVKTAMLVMKPEERWSAKDIQKQAEPELWETIFEQENFDPASEAITESQAHRDGSFEPSPLESSKDEGSNSATSITTVVGPILPTDPGRLYDPARVDLWPSFVSDD